MDKSDEIKKPEILAVEKLVELLHSSDEYIALDAAREILKRVGDPKERIANENS